MTAFPTLDLSHWQGSRRDREAFLESLEMACRQNGFFYLVNHGIPPSLTQSVLAQARLFFDLPESEKNDINIHHSGHFRGYSQMKNERDWREQVHFGQELPAVENADPCYRLVGKNLWPASLGAPFQNTILNYLTATESLGQKLLSAFAALMHLPEEYFEQLSAEPPYLLMKLICYYAQPNALVDRPGVAPHCDWSWLTILLQDDVGGLEVCDTAGHWNPVTSAPGMLSVNIGELLEICTRGRFIATAHRVINPSGDQRRISVPVFINPGMDATIAPLPIPATKCVDQPREHVHRVIEKDRQVGPFNFGNSEWERKGEGKWCYSAACL